MACRTAAILMTLSELQGHSFTVAFSKVIFVKFCSGWPDYNLDRTYRGPSATVEPLVFSVNVSPDEITKSDKRF